MNCLAWTIGAMDMKVFELSGKILNNGNEYPEVDEYLRERGDENDD